MLNKIVYAFYSGGGLMGGHKMILRHVDTLRDLGFDAYAYTGRQNALPAWFSHRAPIAIDEAINVERHAIVLPDDATGSLRQFATQPCRIVVFVQNQFNFARLGMPLVDAYPADTFPALITVSPVAADVLRRVYPRAEVRQVRAFADERVFKPGGARADRIVASPRKRPSEHEVIRSLFPRLHPAHAGLPWLELENQPETAVAAAFAGSTLFLSHSRFESLGMTPLEAMAAGCVCSGFLGVGGLSFATADNGFWVPDEDCIAAVDALASAAEVVKADGPELKRRREAGFETARQWSYAAFRQELEAFWMEFAPGARLKNGPLD
ncbi:glycosyltransferase [Phenylobacterium soli]|uniref:Glycosyl transferase family 1 domain-containing protein n=1 Tax=Phenylobacterium soli TaxID=2170551 RepID=A0A328AEI6_9CAUL|nr:glycosyltransferase [Phenylobacterium soli]RAK51178.1 hypothetical protein DJ017_19660 [Phenylobacterium soli]